MVELIVATTAMGCAIDREVRCFAGASRTALRDAVPLLWLFVVSAIM